MVIRLMHIFLKQEAVVSQNYTTQINEYVEYCCCCCLLLLTILTPKELNTTSQREINTKLQFSNNPLVGAQYFLDNQ
jgi:hypothetical protein